MIDKTRWSRMLARSKDPWSVILAFEVTLGAWSPNMEAYGECRRAYLSGNSLPVNLHLLRIALRYLVQEQRRREIFTVRRHKISYDPRPYRPPEAYREADFAIALVRAIERLESQESTDDNR